MANTELANCLVCGRRFGRYTLEYLAAPWNTHSPDDLVEVCSLDCAGKFDAAGDPAQQCYAPHVASDGSVAVRDDD